MKTLRSVSLLALASLALAARADLIGLSSSTPGTLYSVSGTTGAATALTDLAGGLGVVFVGLEFLGDTLYVSDVVVNDSEAGFGTLDLATGVFTQISNQGGSLNWQALTADQAGGFLYTVDVDPFQDARPLLRVAPDGGITAIGPTGVSFSGLAYDDGAGVLYGLAQNGGFYTLDTATDAATLVGATGVATTFADLAFDEATRTMYLNSADADALYTVDVATGLATLVGPNGPTAGFGIDGLAYRPVPEPASMAALGLGALGVLRRRKRA